MLPSVFPSTAPAADEALPTVRAVRLGVRDHDLADVQQQIVGELTDFRFDPAKSNGATEKTDVTAVIDQRLLMFLRSEGRYRRHVAQTMTDLRVDEHVLLDERSEDATDRVGMTLDVQEALGRLSRRDREICAALAEGCSVHAISQRLGCGWYTVKRRIEAIRDLFKHLGLEGWVIDQ